MGESPEEYTSYWLSRFPLLLVHTWLVMQCVANETTFSQYYPNKYRYAELDYSEYEIEEPSMEFEGTEEEIVKDVDFMVKKSPKKQQRVSFYEQRRNYGKRREEDEKKFAVGLYRNLVENNVVSEGDNINTKENLGVKNRRKSSYNRHRSKKPVEEPMVWKVSEK